MKTTANNIIKETIKLKNPEKIEVFKRFFKTGEGEYGEGDLFLGLSVPITRNLSKKYSDIDLEEIEPLIQSEYHEIRLLGLLLLIEKYKKGHEKQAYEMYLKNTDFINNWDLVDLSAPNIVGDYCLKNNSTQILFKLAKSQSLWEKRISILSTFSFIKEGQHELTLEISKMLFSDKHDLMHKAVGWMLREAGKRCKKFDLEAFLKENYSHIPRTTLRYAIEHFPEAKRKEILYTIRNL